MPKESSGEQCRSLFVICGNRLLAKMNEMNYTEARLASAAEVSEQTIRNYLTSTANKPWPAKRDQLNRVMKALGAEPEDVQVEVLVPDPPESDRKLLAEMRFLANPKTVRDVGGKWNAVSQDLQIPGVLTYQRTSEWHGILEVKQQGNHFEAEGEDKDSDAIYASGALFEDGNWLRFHYLIDNARLREYGTAMAMFKGDGKTIEGIFIGRDGPHESSLGLVVSRFVLTRVE